MTSQSNFERVIQALASGDIACDLSELKKTAIEGEAGNRTLDFHVSAFDRDLLDHEQLVSDLAEQGIPNAKKLLWKKGATQDEMGREVALIVGNTKGPADTQWAIVMTGFLPNLEDFDFAVNVKVVEGARQVARAVSKIRDADIQEKADEICELIAQATKLKPERLVALREAIERNDAGKAALTVWDTQATGVALDALTPTAAKPGTRSGM